MNYLYFISRIPEMAQTDIADLAVSVTSLLTTKFNKIRESLLVVLTDKLNPAQACLFKGEDPKKIIDAGLTELDRIDVELLSEYDIFYRLVDAAGIKVDKNLDFVVLDKLYTYLIDSFKNAVRA